MQKPACAGVNVTLASCLTGVPGADAQAAEFVVRLVALASGLAGAELTNVPACGDPAADLLKLMGSPDIASRRWIWEQYDHMVGADTVQRPGGDAAVVRVHGTKKALAITTDCTPRYCFADPVEGGKQPVARLVAGEDPAGAVAPVCRRR